MLCTLLHLPVQPGSALAGWLGSQKVAVTPATLDESMAALQKRGYYDPTKAEQPYLPGFLASLALACLDAAEITVTIRRNGQANLTRFAQVCEGLVQFGMDETNLTLQDVEKIDELAGALLPDWFAVSQDEQLRAELPLGAFLLFKQAGIQADLALADSGFQQVTFKKSRLFEQFKLDQRWVNIFSAEGMRGMLPLDKLPLEDYLNQLCGRGYLEESGADGLQIGAAGQPLADTLGDPALCTLSLSLQTWAGGFPQTGVFLYGAGRLFLAELKPGLMIVQQLSSLDQGQSWLRKLLVKGGQARYDRYIIPAAPKSPPAQTALAGEETVMRPRSWMLSIASGLQKGQRMPLAERLTIGRSAENDLNLADKQISRKHAVIERLGQGYQLRDLGSANGTFINGSQISQPVRLQPGDLLTIGETQILLSGPAGFAAVALPEAPRPVQAAAAVVKLCPKCGAQLKPASKFCEVCGTPIVPAQAPVSVSANLSCPRCGNGLKPGARFCGKCGYQF